MSEGPELALMYFPGNYRWSIATFRGRVVAAAPEAVAQNQPGLLAEVTSRATALCRRAPGRWYEGRFFRSETFDARPAVKLWLHRFETTIVGVLLNVWTTISGPSTEGMFGTAKLRATRSAAIALLNLPYNTIGRSKNGSGREG
jgi:hypothetical protein